MRAAWLLGCALLLMPLSLRAQGPSGWAAADTVPPRPGDVVRLKIWREPTFSGDFTVHEDGTVVFPRLGVVTVTGLSPAKLEDNLIEEYRRYLVNPSIDIMLLRRITILGAVRQPGTYRVETSITVAQALSLAGGVTSDGRMDKVELLRDGHRVSADLRDRTVLADSPVHSGDQLFVPERAWMSRNLGLFVSSVLSIASSVIVALILR